MLACDGVLDVASDLTLLVLVMDVTGVGLGELAAASMSGIVHRLYIGIIVAFVLKSEINCIRTRNCTHTNPKSICS